MPLQDRSPRKRTTLGDVAALAGCDVALVSRVVNKDPKLRIKSQTRARIVKAITDLNYLPSRTARNLRLSQTKIIGLVVPTLTNPTWASLATAIESLADSRDRTLIVGSQASANDRTAQFISMVADGFLDGLMIATPASPELLESAGGLNVVFINQLAPEPAQSIVFDDALAIGLALDHLIVLGHTSIAHIAGPAKLDATRRRAEAFTGYMAKHGLNARHVVSGGLSPHSGEKMMREIWQKSPQVTAVVIANAITAIGAMRSCRTLGIDVPRDLSVVTIHDNDVVASLSPALDAVAMPIEALAEVAVDRLLGGTFAALTTIVAKGTKLIRRESSAHPRRK